MMRRQRHAVPLIALLGVELVIVLALQAMGSIDALRIPWANLSTWLTSSTLDDLAAPILYGAALAIAWWLFISTALCVLAQLSRIPFAVDIASKFTLPAVRRVVDGALVISIASSSFVGLTGTMASADTITPDGGNHVTLVADQTNNSTAQNSVSTPGTGAPANDTMPSSNPSSSTTSSSTTTPSTAPPTSTTSSTTSSTAPASNPQTVAPDSSTNWVPTPSPGAPDSSAAKAPAPAAPAAPAPAAPSTTQVLGAQDHKVAPGDNLWTIARDTIASNTNRSPKSVTDSEVRTYWLKVIDANKDSLRSKDPHWIFPGEIIKLPDIGAIASK